MELSKEQLETLKTGQNSPFWDILQGYLAERVEYLQKIILEDDKLSEELKITQRDLLRKEYHLTKYLLYLPINLVEKEKAYIEKEDEYDPYEK